ncbi:MAG TPA: helix-hairpin-helix domain-containing protein [Arenimonas sp.]|nr:helix-hairpin-helix domain-containing protein [Arenimonas sp.]
MKKSIPLLSLLFSALLAGGAFAADEKVNINTADAATLDRVLDGVGPSKAEAIVAHREQHGAFRSADELSEVKGIGLATIEQNRDRISVGGAAPAARPAAAGAVAKAKTEPAPASN